MSKFVKSSSKGVDFLNLYFDLVKDIYQLFQKYNEEKCQQELKPSGIINKLLP